MARQQDTTDSEEWRDVPGYEGRYQASSHGRVKRLPRWVNSKNGTFALKGMLIFPAGKPNKRTGYHEVTLTHSNGSKERTTIHSVVCRTFHGPRPTSKHQVAHGDGSRDNNHFTNLRWATPKENSGDRAIHDTDQRGERQWKTTITADDVRAIRAAYKPGYGGYSPFVEKYGLTRGGIYRIVKRKNWKHI